MAFAFNSRFGDCHAASALSEMTALLTCVHRTHTSLSVFRQAWKHLSFWLQEKSGSVVLRFDAVEVAFSVELVKVVRKVLSVERGKGSDLPGLRHEVSNRDCSFGRA